MLPLARHPVSSAAARPIAVRSARGEGRCAAVVRSAHGFVPSALRDRPLRGRYHRRSAQRQEGRSADVRAGRCEEPSGDAGAISKVHRPFIITGMILLFLFSQRES